MVTLDQNFERPRGPSCLARSQGTRPETSIFECRSRQAQKSPESPRRYDQSVVVCIGADLTFWPVPEFAPPSGHFLDHAATGVRSPSASAIHTTPLRGNGTAAPIRDQSRENISPTPPRPSTRPAPISNANGGCSCRNAPSPIFRHGAIREITKLVSLFGLCRGIPRISQDRFCGPVALAD
jgi:hypothetical protein